MEVFMIKALITGLLISIIAGFLGCIIVWKRLACFSDSISHGIMPGIALGFLFNISLGWSAFFTAIIISLLLDKLKDKILLSTDTLLIIISQLMFSIGLIIIYKSPEINSNIMHLLLGDILTISWELLAIIGLSSVFILGFLIINWQKIIILCFNEEIALSEGVNIKFYNIVILLLIAIFTAISLQTVGIILATSVLLIPTATARIFARTPTSMPYISAIFGIIGTIIGISTSFFIDIPTAPSIVFSLGLLLIICFFFKNKLTKV